MSSSPASQQRRERLLSALYAAFGDREFTAQDVVDSIVKKLNTELIDAIGPLAGKGFPIGHGAGSSVVRCVLHGDRRNASLIGRRFGAYELAYPMPGYRVVKHGAIPRLEVTAVTSDGRLHTEVIKGRDNEPVAATKTAAAPEPAKAEIYDPRPVWVREGRQPTRAELAARHAQSSAAPVHSDNWFVQACEARNRR